MLLLGKANITQAQAHLLAKAAIDNGSAWAKFRQFVAAQGGDLTQVDDPRLLPAAPFVAPLLAPAAGYVACVDAREIGYTVVDLGGGRTKKSDTVDPAVGLRLSPYAKVGAKVLAEQPLLWVHARTNEGLQRALSRLGRAYSFSDEPVESPPLIHSIIREEEPRSDS
jgi:pyrimidine-nucleoside phosphorylase